MHINIAAFAGSLLVCALVAPAALAHTRLESSSPQAESVVSAPAQVRLQFSDPLELPFSKIKLVDARGGVIVPVKIAIDPANAKALVAATPGLRSGAYRVQWSTVTRDGHKVKGEFGFQVQ